MTNISTDKSVQIIQEIAVVDGQITTTSNQIAEHFGKRHDTVLRAIANLDIPSEWRRRNFAETVWARKNPSGGAPIKTKAYRVTRDGFTLLAMGFTGKEATQWKIAYIDAFNKMEAELLEKRKTPYAIAPNQTLSAEQADTLRNLITEYAQTLTKDQQAAFIIKAWSKLKKHFGVSYRQIPHSEYTEALSMIGRHIAEYSIPALPAPQRESVNDQVMRLAKQLTAPNGYGVDAFLPLWVAINRKLERRLRVEHVYELIQWKKH